ncbi:MULTISPECIES: hypothetical protein [Halorussus]|uniref:hypothetical protein n=1 Tax=Halorussus TaxID=1070314 RepID=UPI00209D0277|nr:hypothetical protein [Halorussus vallis]USZ74041.1 hypothetical protein NGM07_11295 [Halorussus vallis]
MAEEKESMDPDRSVDEIQDDLDSYSISDETRDAVRSDARSNGHGGGSIVTKPQLCGDYCSGCPHGPYSWLVDDDGWHYLGRVSGTGSDAEIVTGQSSGGDGSTEEVKNEFAELPDEHQDLAEVLADLNLTKSEVSVRGGDGNPVKSQYVVDAETLDGDTQPVGIVTEADGGFSIVAGGSQYEFDDGYPAESIVRLATGQDDRVESDIHAGGLDDGLRIRSESEEATLSISNRSGGLGARIQPPEDGPFDDDYIATEQRVDSFVSGFKRYSEGRQKGSDIIAGQVVDEYGGKVLLDSPFEAKDDIKDLDWDDTHREWKADADAWAVDVGSISQVEDELRDEGWDVYTGDLG